MSSKKPTPNIAKVTLHQVSQPTLSATARTTEFALESLGGALHMPPPIPQFEVNNSRGWYSGVPIAMFVSVANLRFQALRDVSVTVQAQILGRVVFKESNTFDRPIDPQKWVIFNFGLVCPVEGSLEVSAIASFSFENAPYSLRAVETIRIQQSMAIKYSTRKKPSEVVQFGITNRLPFRMMNVKSRTPNGDNLFVSEGMDEGENVSAFFRPTKSAAVLEVSWSLPWAQRCVQTIRLKEMTEDKPNPIAVEVTGVPETWPALKPFTIVLKLKNTGNEAISGEITVSRNEQLILTVGKSDLKFENLKEKDVELTLVSLWQGSYQIPPFTCSLTNGQSFTTDVNKGVLVVGYGDE